MFITISLMNVEDKMLENTVKDGIASDKTTKWRK
jgi:hypothetical protein